MSDALANEPRVLAKVVPSLVGSSSGGTLSFVSAALGTNNTEGWGIMSINNSTQSAFVWRGYLDLAGYENEQLTFFINGINVQENQGITGAGDRILVSDLITKTPITDDELNLAYYQGQVHYAPGFGYSLHDMEQTLMGRLRQYYHDSGWTMTDLQMLSSSNTWGEGNATAANRIFITRIVTCADDDAQLSIPNANYQVAGVAMDEPDLEYIMRLRRDYELAATVDA
jgi:hypothetical protein